MAMAVLTTIIVLVGCLASVSSVVSLPSLAVPAVVPAFVWSNTQRWEEESGDRRRISYQTSSAADLAVAVKEEVDEAKQVDVVMAFFGTKLRSVDVSRDEGMISDLQQVLSTAVMAANSSTSLPYVAPPRDGGSLSEALVSSILGSDLGRDGSRVGEVVSIGSCLNKKSSAKSHAKSSPVKRLASLNALKEFLVAGKEKEVGGAPDFLIVCSSGAYAEFLQKAEPLSEGQILDELLLELDQSKTRYVSLYATDVFGEGASSKRRPSERHLGSALGEEEFCNVVCQTKASVLEGLFVGITLLAILISGICCMSGIESPNRFETSKDGQ